jgi:hypothetical protein
VEAERAQRLFQRAREKKGHILAGRFLLAPRGTRGADLYTLDSREEVIKARVTDSQAVQILSQYARETPVLSYLGGAL